MACTGCRPHSSLGREWSGQEFRPHRGLPPEKLEVEQRPAGPTDVLSENRRLLGAGRVRARPLQENRENRVSSHMERARREAREEERVLASTNQIFCMTFNRSKKLPQPPKSLFLFWTVHGPFSLFLRSEKEKTGGALDQPSSWLKSSRPSGQIHAISHKL